MPGAPPKFTASPLKNPNQYNGDRFIPARSGESIAVAYHIHGIQNSSISDSKNGESGKTPRKAKDEQSHRDETTKQVYAGIIRNELFGSCVESSPVSGRSNTNISSSQNRNTFSSKRCLFSQISSKPSVSHDLRFQTIVDMGQNTLDLNTTDSEMKNVESSSSVDSLVANRKIFKRFNTFHGPFSLKDSPLKQAYSTSPISVSSQTILNSPKKKLRYISKVPFKVLDAPELQDDFYLNLVDWSSLNVLGVGLATCVYLWNASTCKVTKLCDQAPYDSVTSVNWMQRGTHLAVGTTQGTVQIWDVQAGTRIRNLTSHKSRVGTLAWNDHILSSGSRDKSIIHHDVRSADPVVRRLIGHRQEVCGLKWNTDHQQLASGGNDNRLLVWDKMNDTPTLKLNDHTAAVKAISWSPHQHGLLASGGGTADRHIRFWNTISGALLNSIDTGSQVCNLAWSKNSNELVSTHGYSQNQVVVWKYPSITPLATLTGHTSRVLYLAMSPDGQTIVTGAGDETLRFWNVFSKNPRVSNSQKSLLETFSRIR